ncbi:SCP2 sterol-binding domain-containing protein [Actinoplanes sp. NPDC049316]|uniref:SCP2 sterol-binding domain-containing protein n=1 Tax=Actinoplanes sp. NPDC049316 TaxID=3154727 RepID=UPI00342D11D8
MSTYPDSGTAYAVFGELFKILAADEQFTERLRAADLTVRLVHVKPDCVIHVAPGEVRFGDDAPEDATVTIKMSCDTAHRLWLGTLLMPAAVAMGKVRIKGKVAKVLELVPILQPAFDRYPQIVAEHGLVDGAAK